MHFSQEHGNYVVDEAEGRLVGVRRHQIREAFAINGGELMLHQEYPVCIIKRPGDGHSHI